MLSHKAVHLIQGINEQKVHSIFCSSNALWIPCHNKEGINLGSFLSENKANSYASLYSANLMRDASLNDRVELRILGDVGVKIRVMNFDTPDVQLSSLASENKFLAVKLKQAANGIFPESNASSVNDYEVIQETLRSASILSFTFRKVVEDVELQDYYIPKGWKILPLFKAFTILLISSLNHTNSTPHASRWQNFGGRYFGFGEPERRYTGRNKIIILCYFSYFQGIS